MGFRGMSIGLFWCSYAFSRPEWQKQQVILVDHGTEIVPAPTIRNNLQAIGRILTYFYRGAGSWEHYQQQQGQETTAPVPTILGRDCFVRDY
jgi:hypothetical protein